MHGSSMEKKLDDLPDKEQDSERQDGGELGEKMVDENSI